MAKLFVVFFIYYELILIKLHFAYINHSVTAVDQQVDLGAFFGLIAFEIPDGLLGENTADV